ncbi:MAG: KamA family radical SAM protein [Candidatus Omnitrophica bacterium]|nr:KamA family radical SAM protein [Candidatus Omnitrophota bacterium]
MDDSYRRIRPWRDVSEAEWEDWHWQLRNRLYTVEQLREVIHLTPEEEEAVSRKDGRLVMAIPPYWASLMDPADPHCPIRRQAVPLTDEFEIKANDMLDPCGEDSHMPVPGLVHRYPDRVLFLVTEQCAMYCRHCTRRRLVGVNHGLMNHYEPAFDYLRNHPEVRDVLISGGDPLMMTDVRLDKILTALREIPHLEFIRIGSRTPVTMPQRVTQEYVEVLKKHKPIWMSLHFCHPKEVTPRLKRAMDLLADGGVPLGSQTVLLNGINDEPAVMKKLMHELLKVRVRPYYIYQCDPAQGISHFRTSVEKGVQIIEALRGHTSGYAVPTFVIDGPGGGGKIPISPNYVISYQDGVIRMRNYAGKTYLYYEPGSEEKELVPASGSAAVRQVKRTNGSGNGANGSRKGTNGSGKGVNGYPEFLP